MGDSGNGQRPPRKQPAGRSCSSVIAVALAVIAAVVLTAGAVPAAASHPASRGASSDPAPCGTFDQSYNMLASPPYAQADIESNPCNLEMRAHIQDTIHGLLFNHYSGWVEALELNTKATGDANSVGQFVEYQQENDGGGNRMCQEFYPVKGAWHPC